MFSPFIADAVSDVTLLAGGFPAKYGGRLSSVLDVTTKEGNSKRLTGNASASVIAAQGLLEGPFPGVRANSQLPIPNDSTGPDSAIANRQSPIANSSRGSFLLAGRRTYLPDVLLKIFGIDGLGYYFYDVMGKANYEPWKDSRFTVTGLAAEDVLDFWDPENEQGLKAKLTWGNRGVSVRWNRVFTPVLYGEAVGAWSNFFSNFHVDLGTPSDATMKTSLIDLTTKADLTWYAADQLTSDFGCEVRFMKNGMSFDFDTSGFAYADTFWPLALHADAKWELVPGKVYLKPGLRLAYYSKGRRLAPEPRLGIKYHPRKNTALNLAVGRFTQPMVTLNSTDAIFSIYDVWLPVPSKRPLPNALHYIAGVEQWLGRDFVVSLEGYYKDYNDLLETRYGDFFTQPDSLLEADGYSYGADVMLRKTEGWVNGWISYSYMWTRRNIGDEVYHPHYDRRHNANAVLTFPQVYWGIDISAKWTLGTGLPYSGNIGYYWHETEDPARGDWSHFGHYEFISGPRDAFRYPVYHRLDAGLTRSWKLKWGELSAFIDVTNVYNAKNVLLYYWRIKEDGLPERQSVGMIPILPTVGVKARF